jgi:hypothetical protein
MTRADSTTPDPTRPEAGRDPLAVCTLPPDGLQDRVEWIRTEILSRATGSERGADRVSWELSDEPGLAAKLDRLVALESECCSGIVFEHGPSRTPGQRRLEVRGVDTSAAIFGALLEGAGEPGDASEPRRIGMRFAKAAGLGAAMSLFVCCVLPIGAAALLGAAAAAPFASLDEPSVIAGAGVLFGGAAFAWQSRRLTTTPRNPTRSGCGPDC